MSNKCDWCGKYIPDSDYWKYTGRSGGLFSTTVRHYCSKRCLNEGESVYKQEEKEKEEEEEAESEKLGFFGRLFRTIKRIVIAIVVILIGFYFLSKETDDDKKSESTQKTEQSTTKKQSTSTTKTTSNSKTTSGKSASTTASSSKSTVSNQKSTASNSTTTSSSNSTSTEPKSAASTTTNASTKNTTAEADISGEIYKALTDILESKGKSLKLNEAEGLTKGYESTIVVQMNQLRGTKYYNNALKEIMRCCPKYASEYSKNGKYFASEAEFYQSYISTDYSKKLKAKKKENR